MRLIQQDPLLLFEPIVDPHDFEMIMGVRFMDGTRACMSKDIPFLKVHQPVASMLMQSVVPWIYKEVHP